MRRLLPMVLGLAACQPAADPTVTTALEQAPAIAPAAVDERSQYTLLTEIESTVGNALSRDGTAMAAVRQSWEGGRFRWEVAYVPVFCTSASSCNVAPFDHSRTPDHRIQQGWMPQLELDAAGFADLGQACAGRQVCVVQVEGTLREFVFDPEFATALRFSDVRLLGARDGLAHESWIRSQTQLRRRA